MTWPTLQSKAATQQNSTRIQVQASHSVFDKGDILLQIKLQNQNLFSFEHSFNSVF